jgi:glycosyltransferase involved in cell wall biosynthesis
VPEQPTITYLGRVAPNKGHEYFIQALGLLPPDVQGIMVGDVAGDTADGLRGIAKKHGCDDRLDLRPWASREEVLDLIDHTSVFVFPSLWPETLGIVGIEALSRGVPVVASDLGGVREWCIDGETGFVVPPKDPQAISAAVQRLLDDPQRLAQMGRRGIELIHDRFRPDGHVDRLVEQYEAAVGTTDASPSTA